MSPPLPFGPPELERSLVRRFEQQVARQPHHLAARIRDAAIAYAELDRAANRVAHALLEALGEGAEPVLLLLEPGLEPIAAHLGVLKAGKFCVPLDPSQPHSRLAGIIAGAVARAVLTDGAHTGLAAELAGLTPAGTAMSRPSVLDVGALPAGLSERPPGIEIEPDALAYVFHTSGSTGEPKGVLQSQRTLLEVARLYHEEHGLGPDDRVLCPTPLVYAGGVWVLLGTLTNGASLHRTGVDGAARLVATVSGGNITVAQLIPSLLRQFLREVSTTDPPRSLRLVYTGGEVLHPADVARFGAVLPAGCELLYDLGSTEAGLICHHRIDAAAGPESYVAHHEGKALLPVGTPLAGVEVLLLDEDGRPAAPGQAGEIAVRSAHLSPGYWRDPERTRAVFRPDPAGGSRRIYATGDWGAALPDGRLLHLGRKDFQAKIRGQRIGLAGIETTLRADPAIIDAVVVARDDGQGDARLVAYVAVASPGAVTVSAIRQRLAAVLPAAMVPSAFVFLDALPVSPAGKVDRTALPEPGRGRPPLDVVYAAPCTGLEKVLADLWAEVLELDEVGVDDDFLDLGGHSLAAARLGFGLNTRLGIELPLSILLGAPTVAAQARAIADLLAHGHPDDALTRALDHIETS